MSAAVARGTSVAAAEEVARSILRRFQISYGAQVDLEQLAWHLGIVVRDAPLERLEARVLRRGRRAVMTLSSSLRGTSRRVFTLAHELGHFLLHTSEQNQLSLCFDEAVDSLDTKKTEREANAFAVELLMPAERWKLAAHTSAPNMDLIRQLAAEHQVGLQTAAIRFVELSSAPCALAYCAGRTVTWATHSPVLTWRIEKGMRVQPTSLAAGFLEGHPMPEKPTPVPASAWFRDLPKGGADEVIEHCVPMPGLRAALSLIAVPLSETRPSGRDR